jgi:hypothetical protein
MIKTTCACGESIAVGEDAVGQPAQCACGRSFRFVTAESPLPAGSGDGDFDSRLVIIDGPDSVKIPLLLGGVLEIEIGKLPGKHLQLAGGKSVSRNHAKLSRLDFGPSRWMLHDCGSTNGTFVNGEKVAGPVELQDGDQIAIGDYTLQYAREAAPAAVVAAPPPLAVPKATGRGVAMPAYAGPMTPRRSGDHAAQLEAANKWWLYGHVLAIGIPLVLLLIGMAVKPVFTAGMLLAMPVALVLMGWGYIGLLMTAAREGAVTVLLYLFVPVYPLYFVLSRFDETKGHIGRIVAGFGLILLAVMMIPKN